MTSFTESLHAQSSRSTVIDLFSGAGGTGLGFQKAGFDIVGAVEIDKHASETYEKNLHVNVKRVDIRELSAQVFRHELELDLGELDVLVGCPPCQGFSRMRNHMGWEDGRNDLVLRYLEYVKAFMPQFAVFENVPGLIRTKHGQKFYQLLIEGLIGLGYNLTEHEEEIANFGIAQHRKRVIVLAGRDREKPPFPKKTHGKPGTLKVVEGLYRPWLTVWDVIGNNKYPQLEAGENGEQGGKYPNHIAPMITESRVLEFIKMVPHDGGSRKDVEKYFWLPCHLTHDGHADVYGRLAWHRQANTVTGGCTNLSKGRFVHPEQDRSLTPREAAALQGFPDDYIFYGGDFASQIGNAVPPPLAYAIASLLKAILDQEKSTNHINNHLAMDTLHTVGVSNDR